jgi:hypothetical protein
MRLLFGLLLLIISLTVFPLSSQGFQRIESPPPLVRITGIFLNAEAAKQQASIMQLRYIYAKFPRPDGRRLG